MPSNLQFYTLAQVAELFHIDPCTLWRWRRRKLLHVVKVGGRVLVPAAEVERLVSSTHEVER